MPFSVESETPNLCEEKIQPLTGKICLRAGIPPVKLSSSQSLTLYFSKAREVDYFSCVYPLLFRYDKTLQTYLFICCTSTQSVSLWETYGTTFQYSYTLPPSSKWQSRYKMTSWIILELSYCWIFAYVPQSHEVMAKEDRASLHRIFVPTNFDIVCNG